MFTKNDFIDLFNEISELEEKMSSQIEELSQIIEDEETRELVNKLKAEKIKHIEVLDKVRELVLN